ncbi:hypothetical protein ACIRU3_05120 [Streptomyces sp. NPDC101151]|uniref:hypothetical protein n=1 Tax=Streptomyces sp. NPDC101151 TaxID=3366115 RepID=UPI0037F7B56E
MWARSAEKPTGAGGVGQLSTDGHRLIVYQAEPGSPGHDAMVLLGMADPAVTDGIPRRA